jgi:hypothetical protein
MADPWVAPDTPATSAPPSVPTPTPAPTAPADPATAAAAVPVPLRPLTVPDLLDGGLRAFKLAPATMAAVTAVFVVPTQALLGVLSRDAVDDVRIGQAFTDAFEASGPADVETGLGGDLFLVALVVEGITLAFVTAAVARLVTGWYTGRTAAAGELVTGALRRSWALAAAWVLVHLVEGAFALALVVPAIVPMAWYAVVSPVIACEDAGPLRAMGRSFQLCKRRFGAVLATCLLTALVHEVLTGALSALGAAAVELDVAAAWAVNTAVAAAALLVTMPFVAGVATLLYLDLRVRTEGLDIELAAARRFAAS